MRCDCVIVDFGLQLTAYSPHLVLQAWTTIISAQPTTSLASQSVLKLESLDDDSLAPQA